MPPRAVRISFRLPPVRRLVLMVAAVSCALGLCVGRTSAALAPYAPALIEKVVRIDLSGIEPDFDQVYRVVIDATLHDTRPAGIALRDSQLILSSYMELFQPGSVLLLPDVLHPDQPTAGMVAFLHGKAALVSVAGRVAYKGSMLAELFRDSTVHITMELYDVTAGVTAPPMHLLGSFTMPCTCMGMVTLTKGVALRGALRALDPHAFAALRALRGHPLSWQAVIGQLAIAPPPMMIRTANGGCGIGTVSCRAVAPPTNSRATARIHVAGGAGVARATPVWTAVPSRAGADQTLRPARHGAPSSGHGTSVMVLATAVRAMLLLDLGLLVWWCRSRRRKRASSLPGPPSAAAECPATCDVRKLPQPHVQSSHDR